MHEAPTITSPVGSNEELSLAPLEKFPTGLTMPKRYLRCLQRFESLLAACISLVFPDKHPPALYESWLHPAPSRDSVAGVSQAHSICFGPSVLSY